MKPKRLRQSVPLYLIPIMIGLSGMLVAQQFADPLTRALVVLVSVGAPLFAVGHAMARLNATRGRKIILALSAVLLTLGGVVTLLDIATGLELKGLLATWTELPLHLWEAIRWTILVVLLLGLFILLYSVVLREEEISELAHRFSSLAEHMSEGFALAAPDGTVKMVNQSFLRMTGLETHQILGPGGEEVARQLKLQPLLEEMEGRHQGVATEYTLSWPRNGSIRYFLVSVTPVFDQAGEFTGTLATFRDITDLHELNSRLEEYTKGLRQLVEDRTRKLRESQEQMRGLLLNMNEGFLTLSTDYKVVFANDRICSLLQRSNDQVLGADVFEFVDPVGHNRLLELLRTAHSQGTERLQQELTLQRSDGSAVPVMVAVAPVVSESEQEACYSMVLTDISALKAMQRQLLERANDLEAANEELRMLGRAKDGFLTTVSHELRTPLSTIRGYVEMFTSGTLGEVEPAQANALQVMERNLQRLGFLIEEMIEFGRMQVRGIELSWTLFDIGHLVTECVHSTEPHLHDRQLSIEQHVPEGLPAVWGDRKRLGQVVAILLSNALKFSRKGGTIAVHVEERTENTLAILVKDEGIGIDKAHQLRIFEKFYQVDSSLSRRYEGAGIGLSIAKSIVDAHGGSIEVDSELDVGTTFTLLFPHALFRPSISEETSSHIGDLYVLLQDNDPEEQIVLQSTLETVGIHVLAGANSFETLRMAADEGPDIALLSDALTDLPWSTVMSRLHENPATSTIPAIVLRNGDAEEDEGEALTHGDTHTLPRPFSAEQLVRSLIHVAFGSTALDAPQSLEIIGASRRSVALIVDSDPDHLEWMETALTHRNIPCRCVDRLDQAEDLIGNGEVSVLLLDIDGPGNPEMRIAEAREWFIHSKPPIFALTGMPETPKQIEGVQDVFQKPFKIDAVAEAIAPYVAQEASRRTVPT